MNTEARTPPRRSRGRPTAIEAENLQERLVTIALRHFTQFGFEDASIEAIAREARVTRQSIYQRFGGKKEFFDVVMQRREDRFYDQVILSPTADASQPTTVLFDFGMAMANHLLSADRVELTRAMTVGLHRFPEVALLQKNSYTRARNRIAGYLEIAMSKAGIEPQDCLDAAEDFRNLMNGIAAPVVFGLEIAPDPQERTRRVAGVIARFLRGLGLEPDEAALAERTQATRRTARESSPQT